jgi:hypothetical protein
MNVPMSRPSKPPADELERVSLPTRLDEFRTALEEEIKAAKAGSSEVLLTEGRFVAMVAGNHLYEFETASSVRVPPDTPGELVIEGLDAPIPITVVSIQELVVTLASAASLGRALRSVKLRTNLTMLLRKLIGRIEQKADQAWPAAERLLDGYPVAGKPFPLNPLGKNLNPEQHSAVESALGRNLTFIWGPPGTGKTQTIGLIGRELFLRRRTLLVVSHTNVAVDEALDRIASLCNENLEVTEGEIIRIGEPVKAEMQQQKGLICHHVAAQRSEALQQERATLDKERQETWNRLKELERLITIVEWADEAPEDIGTFRASWTEICKLEANIEETERQIAKAEKEKPLWDSRRRIAVDAQLCSDLCTKLVRARSEISEHKKALHDKLLGLQKDKKAAEHLLAFAREAEPLRQRVTDLPPVNLIQLEVQRAAHSETTWTEAYTTCERTLGEERIVLQKAQSMGKVRRLWHQLPDPIEQAQVVTQVGLDLEIARKALNRAGASKTEAEARLHEVENSLNSWSASGVSLAFLCRNQFAPNWQHQKPMRS